MQKVIKSSLLKLMIPIFDNGRSKNRPHNPNLDTMSFFSLSNVKKGIPKTFLALSLQYQRDETGNMGK